MWHCGKCGKVWDTYLLLNIIPDPDDKTGKSNIGQCECGYRFHRDKWQITTKFSLVHHITILHYLVNLVTFGLLAKPLKLDGKVSSVFLELDHGMNYGQETPPPPVLYETMAWTDESERNFGRNWDFFRYLQNRYTSQQHAMLGHAEILDDMEDGLYHIYYRKNYDGQMETIALNKDWMNPFHGFTVGETVERGISTQIP